MDQSITTDGQVTVMQTIPGTATNQQVQVNLF